MKSFMFILILIAFVSAFAWQQQLGAQVVVPNSVLGNGGGATLSDSSYRVVATVGEPVIGVTGDASHTSAFGFWYLPGVLVTSVEQDPTALPTEYRLEQNYPNPFNPTTTIRFALPEASHVALRIFNMLGQEIRTLVDSQYGAGYHSVRWDGKTESGNAAASGVYVYQFRAGDFLQTRKMLLLR